MGWDFGINYTGKPLTTAEIDEKMRKNFPSYITPIGDGAVVNRAEYYLAVYDEHEKRYTCTVSLIRNGKNEFGKKDMCENMGPTVANCPKRILDIIEQSEPDGINAFLWRKACWQNLAKAKLSRQLKDGDILRFEKTLGFADGVKENQFVVRKLNNKTIFERVNDNVRCRISDFKNRSWEKLPSIQTTAMEERSVSKKLQPLVDDDFVKTNFFKRDLAAAAKGEKLDFNACLELGNTYHNTALGDRSEDWHTDQAKAAIINSNHAYQRNLKKHFDLLDYLSRGPYSNPS